MKNFNEFVKSSEPSDVCVPEETPQEGVLVETSPEQARRDANVGYFKALKEVIDGVGGFYYPGDLVMSVEAWYTLSNKPEIFCSGIIYARRRELGGKTKPICQFQRGTFVDLLDIPILKQLMKAEGMDVVSKEKEDGIVMKVYAVGKQQ